jgi:hypothetical protein
VRETTTIERRRESDERAERILGDALKGRGGALTRADAIALSGLSAAETDGALRQLLRDYKSHLAVTEKGELIYKFDPAMVRRDAVTLGERLRELGQALWRGFTFLFKIWIVVTLVFYVVAFAAMMIALVFARSSSDRDDRRHDDGGFGFPWLLWWMMPDWAPPSYQQAQRRRLPQGPRKRFYRSVFDFVFGPPAGDAAPLAAEKEVVAYLRAVEGRVTATDLVALTGWSYARAEEEATRLLCAYDGEPEVTDDGTIVYSFPSLRTTAGDVFPSLRASGAPAGAWRYTWSQPRALPPLSGNTEGTNVVIGLMNGFNLFAALAVGPAFLARFGVGGPAADLVVTWFPLAFSSLFFAIPGGRAVKRSRAARRLAAEAMRAQLLGEIFARNGEAVRPAELVEAARRGVRGRAAGADPAGEALARAALEQLLVDLDGDVTTDEQGETLYRFPRIGEELLAAAHARELAPAAEREAGQVVFASDTDADAPALEADDEPRSPPPPLLPRRTRTRIH